jgi:hypothetical protein
MMDVTEATLLQVRRPLVISIDPKPTWRNTAWSFTGRKKRGREKPTKIFSNDNRVLAFDCDLSFADKEAATLPQSQPSRDRFAKALLSLWHPSLLKKRSAAVGPAPVGRGRTQSEGAAASSRAAAAAPSAKKQRVAASTGQTERRFGSGAPLKHSLQREQQMKAVLGQLCAFSQTKSRLEEVVEARGKGHIVLLSAKYHAECAGQGIEYCFGRCKWWFKKHNTSPSTESLKRLSSAAFGREVVTLDHVRNFARKNRDYHRVYRAGVVGLDADDKVKFCKMHRCALDSHYTFITEDITQ